MKGDMFARGNDASRGTNGGERKRGVCLGISEQCKKSPCDAEPLYGSMVGKRRRRKGREIKREIKKTIGRGGNLKVD